MGNNDSSDGWHRGDWMQTYTGLQFYPMSPRAEDVMPEDIAHSLSLTCRYNGHVDRFYSVAEHCLLLSIYLPEEFKLWGLLHDAAEAYVGDMVRPLKRQQPTFQVAEDLVLTAIAERFGLEGSIIPDEVKEVDTRILLDERAALMSATRHQWAPYVETLEPLGVQIQGMPPKHAEAAYFLELKNLTERS